MAERYFQHTFENGLTLLVEKMSGVQSGAMTFLVDAGGSTDPVDRSGSATVLSDLILRGAGQRDNKALTDYLDSLGLQRSSSVGVHHTRLGCAAVAGKVLEALPTYADIVRRPHLPADGFTAARDLALQSLEGIEDEPRQKLMIKLREWFFPSPYGRNTMGDKEQLQKLTIEAARADWQRRYRAGDAILSLAGNIDFEQAKDLVGKALGDWARGEPVPLEKTPPPGNFRFEHAKSEQTHIGLAYPSLPETHPDYYTLRLAVEVLSGGMSGRLFTEVREKRALVYNVWAGYSSLKGIGGILGYAGTSNDRAQATLDVFVSELFRLSEGITADELDRAKTGLKASTIMQGESTSARASAIAHDFFVRGRIRTLDEIKAAIDGVSLDQVNEFLKANPPGPFTVVIVGPRELSVPGSAGAAVPAAAGAKSVASGVAGEAPPKGRRATATKAARAAGAGRGTRPARGEAKPAAARLTKRPSKARAGGRATTTGAKVNGRAGKAASSAKPKKAAKKVTRTGKAGRTAKVARPGKVARTGKRAKVAKQAGRASRPGRGKKTPAGRGAAGRAKARAGAARARKGRR